MTPLQEKRQRLAAQLRQVAAIGDEHGWRAEDRENFERISNDYDECYSAMLIEHHRPPTADDSARMMLGRDNARIGDAGATIREPSASNQQHQVGTALAGWLGLHAPEFTLRNEHREAAQALNLNLASNQIDIRIGNTATVDMVRRQLRGSTLHSFQNALSTQTGADGGFTIAETFVGRLEEALLSFGGMFEASEIIRTARGDEMRWPTADDTDNTGAQIGESTDASTTTADPDFAQIVWHSYKYTSRVVRVPFELLEDNQVDLGGKLGDMLGVRLARIQNQRYTTGTGASQAKGIVTAATAGVTTSSSTAIAADELIDLCHSLDPSRRNRDASWMFHDNLLKVFRKLKDGDGQYLWQPGMTAGQPDLLFGYPLTINQDMSSTITSGDVTVLFGQMGQYKIRQVGSIRLLRLNERYAENDQVGFLAFMRGDGNLLDAGDGPVKKMTQV